MNTSYLTFCCKNESASPAHLELSHSPQLKNSFLGIIKVELTKTVTFSSGSCHTLKFTNGKVYFKRI